MTDLSLVVAFIAATAIYAIMPGPAMLYTAAQTMARGRRSGLMAAAGIHLGGYAHVAAAAAGLSVLFEAIPALALVVRLGGAAYLIWLGIGLCRAPRGGEVVVPVRPEASGRRAFIQSVVVELLNPKTALFFLAFLPPFIDPSAGVAVWVQVAVLGTIVNATFSVAEILCVLLAGAVTERLRRSRDLQRLIRRSGGAVLIGLGADLALLRG